MKKTLFIIILLFFFYNFSSNNNYKIYFDDDEPNLDLLYQVIWGEARGEGTIGQIMVLDVIKNRMKHPYFPKQLDSVLLMPKQFYVNKNLVVPKTFKTKIDSLYKLKPISPFLYFVNLKGVKNPKIRKWVYKYKLYKVGNHTFF